MVLDNKFMSLLFNNMLIGLGVAFLVFGIFFLLQGGQGHVEIDKSVIQIDSSGFELEYKHLFDERVEEFTVIIPSGSSGLTVARILEENGLMAADDFKIYLTMFDIESRIKAGTYTFYEDSTAAEVLNKILIKRR